MNLLLNGAQRTLLGRSINDDIDQILEMQRKIREVEKALALLRQGERDMRVRLGLKQEMQEVSGEQKAALPASGECDERKVVPFPAASAHEKEEEKGE